MAKKSARLKGKQWYTLKAPDMFNNQKVGEAVARNDEELMGRTVEAGATDLVSGCNKYYFKVYMKVDEVEGETGKCKFAGHDSSRDFITRMIRRRSKRIDDRTVVETKDGKELVAKIVCATIKSVGASTQTGVRRKISETLKEKASEMTLAEFVDSLFSGKIQGQLKREADKVYPIRAIEIRKTELVE
ncbi:MAG: hypothetical protein ACLFS3_02640 [Candidatus Aenigmatarchaeota archaeon]